MSELDSTEYYREREQKERALAVDAVDPGVALIHSQIADRYAELAGNADPEAKPRLKLHVSA